MKTKPFNYEEYLAGKTAITEAGVLVTKIERTNDQVAYPLRVSLADSSVVRYTIDGEYIYGDLSSSDLVLIDESEDVTTMETEHPEQEGQSSLSSVDHFRDLTKKMADTYERKNHDYGNSFDQSLDKFGIVAAVVRISDKFNRLCSLYNKEAKVNDESLSDTLMDMACYCIMTKMYLDKKGGKQ